MFYIQTQAIEWYGNEDFTVGRYKPKGGKDYLIEGDYFKAIAYVAEQCIWNDYCREWPLEPEMVTTDFMTPFEKDQLSLEGDVKYPAIRVTLKASKKFRRENHGT